MRWQLTSESIRKEVRNVPDSVDCCPAKSCSTKLYCEANRAQIQIGHIQIVHSINSVTFLFCLTAVEFRAMEDKLRIYEEGYCYHILRTIEVSLRFLRSKKFVREKAF